MSRKAPPCIRTSIALSPHPARISNAVQGVFAIAPRSTSRRPSRPSSRFSGDGFIPFLLGFVVCAALAAATWFYFQPDSRLSAWRLSGLSGSTPSPSMASPQRPAAPTTSTEPELKPKPPQPPFGTSEDVFESGARLYAAHCAVCHGSPAHDAPLALSLNPVPLPLWRRRDGTAAVGVSAQMPGQIYLSTRDGIPHTGMPAYKHQLSETQLWQIALLLKNADQPLPDPVDTLLSAAKPSPATPSAANPGR